MVFILPCPQARSAWDFPEPHRVWILQERERIPSGAPFPCLLPLWVSAASGPLGAVASQASVITWFLQSQDLHPLHPRASCELPVSVSTVARLLSETREGTKIIAPHCSSLVSTPGRQEESGAAPGRIVYLAGQEGPAARGPAPGFPGGDSVPCAFVFFPVEFLLLKTQLPAVPISVSSCPDRLAPGHELDHA